MTAIVKPLLAFIGPVSYALETRPGMRSGVVHAFRGIVQRDDWVSKDPGIRSTISTKDQRIIPGWENFSLILHPDTRSKWCPLV